MLFPTYSGFLLIKGFMVEVVPFEGNRVENYYE